MPPRRFASLDFFRGLMLAVMAVDHLAGTASPPCQLLGAVSAAEGFLFLSGVVVGFVYGRGALEPARLRARAFGRAGKLYRYHLVLLAVVILLAFALPGVFGAAWRDHLPFLLEHPVVAALLSLTFLNQPRFFDILPLYTLFLLATPWVLGALARGRARLVLALSAGLWLLAQLGLQGFILRQLPYYWKLQPGSFDPFAWQLLFVVGVWFGYGALQSRPVVPQGRAALLLALAVALPLLALRHGLRLEPPGFPYLQLEAMTNRAHLGWLRLLDFAAVALVLARLVAWRPALFQARWFVFLGRHSLQVFAAHVFALYLVTPLQWRVLEWGVWGGLLALLFVVLSLTLPALLHERVLRERRARAKAGAPLPQG